MFIENLNYSWNKKKLKHKAKEKKNNQKTSLSIHSIIYLSLSYACINHM